MTTLRIQRAINILEINITELKNSSAIPYLIKFDLDNIAGWLSIEGINAILCEDKTKLYQIRSAIETLDFISVELCEKRPSAATTELEEVKDLLLKIQEHEEQ